MVYVRVVCGVRYVSMGLCQEEDIIQPMERMTSSGDHHQDAMSSGASRRDQVLESCHPLWCQWTCEDVSKSGSPIVDYGEQSSSLHRANAIKKGGPS